jgi:hypothetical protein
MPGVVKDAVVSMAVAFPNVTLPAPLTLVHAVVKAPGGAGFASSVTVPLSAASAGKVAVASLPALTLCLPSPARSAR